MSHLSSNRDIFRDVIRTKMSDYMVFVSFYFEVT